VVADGAGKYGTIIVLDKDGTPKVFPTDMPIFVLLGQDLVAEAGVAGYADGLEAHGLDLRRPTCERSR
jgi:hypothetical protein